MRNKYVPVIIVLALLLAGCARIPAGEQPAPSGPALQDSTPAASPENETINGSAGKDEQNLYLLFFETADPDDLTWSLTDGKKELAGSYAERSFDLPPVPDWGWEETDVPPGESPWRLSITDTARSAGVTFFGETNCIMYSEEGTAKYYKIDDEVYDANYPLNASYWARATTAGPSELPPRSFLLTTQSEEPETVAMEYAEAYAASFEDMIEGCMYAASDHVCGVSVREVREDGGAFIFQAHIGHTPVDPDKFRTATVFYNPVDGQDGRVYFWSYFLLEKRGTGWQGIDWEYAYYYDDAIGLPDGYFAAAEEQNAPGTMLYCLTDDGRELTCDAGDRLTPEQAAEKLAGMYMDDLCTESDGRTFRVTEYRDLSATVIPTGSMNEEEKAIYYLSAAETGDDMWIVEINVEYRYEGTKSPAGPSNGEWMDVLYQGSPTGFLMTADADGYSLRRRVQ